MLTESPPGGTSASRVVRSHPLEVYSTSGPWLVRVPTAAASAPLRRSLRLPDQAQLARANHCLDPRLHAEMAAKLDEVAFDGATRQSEDASDVGRAFAFLNPGQAFQLSGRDQTRRTRKALGVELRTKGPGLIPVGGVALAGQLTDLLAKVCPPN